jgi:hypothetical protein
MYLASADLTQGLPQVIPTGKNAGLAIKRIFFGLLIVAVGGFYFFLNLFDNYAALHDNRDRFYSDLLPLFIFLALAVGALIALLHCLLRRKKNPARTIYLLMFVICACTSFLFRGNFSALADQVFFSENETYFKTKAHSVSAHPATTVFFQSSVNFHKLIIHSTSQINDGTLSLATIDALGAELSGLRGCKIESKALRDSFYVLRAYC